MKAFLLAGAVLMTGASVYGIIDFKKSSKDREFENLYRDRSVTETPAKDSRVLKTTPAVAEPSKVDNATTSNSATEVASTGEKTGKVVSRTRKKKLNIRLFSRAPLEARYINTEKADSSSLSEQKRIKE